MELKSLHVSDTVSRFTSLSDKNQLPHEGLSMNQIHAPTAFLISLNFCDSGFAA
jgi:hypothetical protein